MFQRLKVFFKIFAFCIVAVVIGILYYNADIIIEVTDIDIIIPFINNNKESYVQFHRQLEFMLLEAEEYIEKENYLKALLKIRTVVALLDNRYYDTILPNSYLWSKKVRKPVNTNQSIHQEKVSFGTNLFESAITEPKIPLSSIVLTEDLKLFVTVLINDCENQAEEISILNLISQMRNEWSSLKIILSVNNEVISDFEGKLQNVEKNLVTVPCHIRNQTPLKALLEHVTTPYILVLSSVSAVTSDLNITRLLKTASGLNGVGVVGMAERGVDAGWDYTCLQLKIQNAHLDIIDGYEHSKESCLLCDVTSNSFLVDTSVLLEFLPDSSLPLSLRQLDWALRLRNANVVTLTCPDVMIHTNNKVVYDKKSNNRDIYLYHEENEYLELKSMYLRLAQNFKFQKISFSNGTQLEYSCLELNYICNLAISAQIRKLAINPCCFKEKEVKLRNVNSLNKKLLIPYKIDETSLLEAVKYKNGIYPDIDVTIHYHSMDLLHKSHKESSSNYENLQTIQPGIDKLNNSSHNSKMYNNSSNLDLRHSSDFMDYILENSTYEVPNNFPCLLFGHYAIPVFEFINNSSEIIKSIYTEGNHTQYKNNVTSSSHFIESIREPKCYFYSLVKVGLVWVPASFNPGKHVLDIFGNFIYRN